MSKHGLQKRLKVLVWDGDGEGWVDLLPGHCDITKAYEYRMKLQEAKPDPDRTEPYMLRGSPRRMQ